jgi:hypothetical protein
MQLLLQVDKSFTVLEKPNLVFGGISASFDHAARTEEFLVPAPIFLQQRWLGMKKARVFLSGKPETLQN